MPLPPTSSPPPGPKSSLYDMLFFHRTPVFRRVWLPMAVLVTYTMILVQTYQSTPDGAQQFLETEVTVVNGFVLSLLMAFRTNAAYARWWEARQLWGQLVNDSRNLSLKVRAYVQAEVAVQREMARILIAFPYALKEHLREGVQLQYVPGFANVRAQPKHVPAYLAGQAFNLLERWKSEKRLGMFEFLTLDRHARALMDVCGACERIRRTSMPPSYIWYLRQGIMLSLAALPLSLAPDLGYWKVLIVAVASYFILGVEYIAEEVEEPFGTDADDLPLEAVCLALESTINEILPPDRD